ncbi:DMT family transporter [Yoonia sp.]|uniref:DMT family transporter n=1 Tax=Yoonia sp. TaxID=2212373 RepID=UPI002383BD22|nr:DMT family transporter [Yoonia sp.]MDE0851670.1 DMT family transporter [Yoonia sp.]
MDNVRGATLMVLAMFGFAIEDMLIKQMAAGLPVGQVVTIIGAGGAIIFGFIAKSYGDGLWSADTLHPALLIRNVCEIFGTLGFVAAIALTPISTASAILQATPLVVTLGAAMFLGETVGWRRWMAIMIGLFGVLLIIRPGMDAFDAKSLLAVLGVVGLAGRDLATRRIPKTISSRIVAFNAFVISIFTGMILLAFGVTGSSWTTPDTIDSFRLVAAIFVGVAAYYAIVAATRIGDMSIIAPFRYSRLVFALIIGVLAFGESPDTLTLVGAGIIVASGIYTLLREARLRRTSPSPSSTL